MTLIEACCESSPWDSYWDISSCALSSFLFWVLLFLSCGTAFGVAGFSISFWLQIKGFW